jgi:hypothetical protein
MMLRNWNFNTFSTRFSPNEAREWTYSQYNNLVNKWHLLLWRFFQFFIIFFASFDIEKFYNFLEKIENTENCLLHTTSSRHNWVIWKHRKKIETSVWVRHNKLKYRKRKEQHFYVNCKMCFFARVWRLVMNAIVVVNLESSAAISLNCKILKNSLSVDLLIDLLKDDCEHLNVILS